MKCDCGSEELKTLETRPANNGSICRRKQCKTCGATFWTAEIKLNYVPEITDYWTKNNRRKTV